MPETVNPEPSLTYRIRENHRAKSLRLKVSLHQGLEVVVPRGFDQSQIPAILQHRQDWIQQALRQMERNRSLLEPESLQPLPRQINLRAIVQVWQVEYPTAASMDTDQETNRYQIRVRGNIANPYLCQQELRAWIHHQAQQHLIPWLLAQSLEAKLPFNKVIIRSQKTRWGSCSHHQTISLNSQLLFLPQHLVDYILLHELCHTVHLNHSPRFWDLLGQKSPKYQSCVVELRRAWRYVPLWMITDRFDQ